MKALGRIYRWILLSVILQVAVLAYLNYIYLPGGGSVKATMYEIEEEKVVNKDLQIPEEAEQIKVSHNGVYAGYVLGGNLELTDIKDRKNKKTLTQEGLELTYYRWLPDRVMVICGYKPAGDQSGKVLVTTYDMESGLERSYPEITGLPKGSGVNDIELSPLTNMVYVKIKTGETKAKVYRYNIMDNLKFIMNTSPETVMMETGYNDNLVYQADQKLRVRDGKTGKTRTLPLKGKIVLLGIDSEDKVYAGELGEDGNVAKIHFGKLGSKEEKDWDVIEPDHSIGTGNIIISPDGAIYELNQNEKAVYDIVDGKKIVYPGEFIEMLQNYVVSRDGGRLKLTAIEKVWGTE